MNLPSCCSRPSSSEPPARLNHKNILNLIAFIANIVLVYGIGNAGWIGTPTNGELSDKYQTIVTPNSSAFSIWAVIYVFQALFAIGQLLPKFRAVDMVQKGVGYWHCLVVTMQIGWTFTFAYEVIEASLVCMLLLWCSLITLLYSQYYTESDGSLWEFWLLRFPFAIHGGWITAASALNVNVQVVSMEQPSDVQLAVGIISLAVLHAISVWVLFNIPRPNWTIACVLSWALGWIYYELQDPLDMIKDTFSADTISGVAYAAVAVAAGIIPLQILIRLLLLVRPSWNPYKSAAVVDNADEEQSLKESLKEQDDELAEEEAMVPVVEGDDNEPV